MTQTENIQVYPAWLNREQYPFNSHYFQTPAGSMHYVDEGSGDPVVMVHGNPAWSYSYRHLINGLKDKCRCIAPDHIGFGLSDKPADWDYLPIHHAENLEALLDSLQLQKITMVVNDWGGPIGLSFALNHPEKIKKLIILNTWLWSVENDQHFRTFSGIMGGPVGKFMIRNFNFFGKNIVKQAFGDQSKLTPEIHRHYYLHLDTPAHRKGSYIFPKEIIGSSAWLQSSWEMKELINNIPTTFVWGMKDIAFREKELNHWVKNWNNGKVVRVAQAGHFPQEIAPELIIREIL